MAAMKSSIVFGGPDEVGEQIRDMTDGGLDGITLNLVTTGHDPEMIAIAAETANAAIG